MSIVRAPRPERDFTVLRNDVIRDDLLSYKARGLLISILSRPDNWRTTADALARESTEGRTSVLSGLKELERRGYLRRLKRRDAATGRLATITFVFDEPRPPEAGFPTTDNPASGDPASDTPPPLEELTTKNRDEEEPPLPPADAGGAVVRVSPFDVFWQAYPRKAGKRTARSAFERATKRADSAQVIIAAAHALASDPNLPPPQFVPHPTTWLNRDGWLDGPLPPREGVRRVSGTERFLRAAEAADAPPALEDFVRGEVAQ